MKVARNRSALAPFIVALVAIGQVISAPLQASAVAVVDGKGYFTNATGGLQYEDFTNDPVGSAYYCSSDDEIPGNISHHKVICKGVESLVDTSSLGDVIDKTEFINYINGVLTGGNTRDRMGAAFVIQTMRGQGYGASNPPSAGEITDWEDRVNSSKIRIKYESKSYTVNSSFVHYDTGEYDDMYFNEADSTPSLNFIYDADGDWGTTGDQTTAYLLKVSCANPIGKVGLPDPDYWDASGEAFVNGVHDVSAYPSEHVKFTYELNNIGTANAPKIWWSTSGGSSGDVFNLAAGSSKALPSAAPGYEDYTVPNTPGVTYCRHMSFQDSQNDDVTEDSNNACVTVKSNFDLYPGVNGAGGSYTPVPLMTGGTIPLGAEIKNNGSDSDINSPYEVHQFTVENTVAGKPDFSSVFTSVQGPYRYTTSDHANNTACTGWLSGKYAGKITSCALKESGSQKFPAGLKTLGVFDINADDYNPGDWVCRFMSVGIYSYTVAIPPVNNVTHRISQPVCVVIAKQPSVQVWGGDVRVGNNFATETPAHDSLLDGSASVITGTFKAKNSDSVSATFGSWAEYGIFAPAPDGIIKSVSGGALSGAKGLTVDPASDLELNPLSFSNTESGYFGKWEQAHQIDSIEDFVKRYPEGAPHNGPQVPLASIDSSDRVQDGDIKIVRLTNPVETELKGTHTSSGTAILIADQTVRITDDIIIKDTKSKIHKLGYAPQVIIIAKNIIIDSNVKRIDAWLIARPTDPAETLNGLNGKISTCDSIIQPPGKYTDGLKLGQCDEPLIINGAVMAKEVQFRRTYGADRTDGLGAPAEIINLRADAYMWARPTSAAGEGLPIKTMTVTELPPRF